MYRELNPFVRVACNVAPHDAVVGRRVALDHRLFFVNRGTAVMDICGKEYEVTENDLIYIPAYSDYSFRFFQDGADMVLTVVNFDFTSSRADIKSSLKTVSFTEFSPEGVYKEYIPEELSLPVILHGAEAFYADMSKMRLMFFNKEEHYRPMASAILKLLLISFIEKNKAVPQKNTKLEIVAYIREHYGERLTAFEIGEKYGYHPNHVNRLVKLATGRGFKDYLIYYRLKVAKDMLLSAPVSVNAVAQRCGFSSGSYFTEIFSRQEGITPNKYRRIMRDSIL